MEKNGHPSTPFEKVEHEIRALAGAEPSHRTEPPQQIALIPQETTQHPDEMHDLMHKTVDKVCDDWVAELKRVRENSERVEQLVLEQAAKVKEEISQLFVMKGIAAEEARRGDEVNQRLMSELTALQNKR
jgi:hypothetical protein